MKNISAAVVILASMMMFGCATVQQAPLALSEDFYSSGDKVVGVYVDELPKTDTHLVGASCLLCMAAASMANSSLTDHIRSLNTDELSGLNKSVARVVSGKGVKVNPISAPIDISKLGKFKSDGANFAEKDFRPLKDRLNVDKLIVIDLNTVGAYRPYSSYVPTGDPVGTVTGQAYTVDLATNKYELYEGIDFKVSVQGEWDEPPAFPGVTNAYFQAIELTKDKIVSLFQ